MEHFANHANVYVLLMGVIAAICALQVNQNIARKRATIDFVLHDMNSKEMDEAKAVMTLDKDALLDLSKKSSSGSAHRKLVLRLLNQYEFMAVGIREGAFDKKLINRMKHSTVTRTFDKFEPFINSLRQEPDVNSTVFQDFEWLANSFKKMGLKANSK